MSLSKPKSSKTFSSSSSNTSYLPSSNESNIEEVYSPDKNISDDTLSDDSSYKCATGEKRKFIKIKINSSTTSPRKSLKYEIKSSSNRQQKSRSCDIENNDKTISKKTQISTKIITVKKHIKNKTKAKNIVTQKK